MMEKIDMENCSDFIKKQYKYKYKYKNINIRLSKEGVYIVNSRYLQKSVVSPIVLWEML